jgi:hypothetical protein
MNSWTKPDRWVAVLALLALPAMGAAQPAVTPSPADLVVEGFNWTTQIITAKGVGLPPPTAVSPAHGRALAAEAAEVLARRNLLAIIQGVAIDSIQTVSSAMLADNAVAAGVRGIVLGAQVVETREHPDGRVEVWVAMRATGPLAEILIPRPSAPRPPAPVAVQPPAPPAPAPAPAPRPAPAPTIYTGLVIDARGLGVTPAMAPKVLSEGGQEVYGNSVADRTWLARHGMASYQKGLAAAQAHDRVANRPLTIKAMAVTGANKTDVVISTADAQLLLGSGPHLAFLDQARVMIVVD